VYSQHNLEFVVYDKEFFEMLFIGTEMPDP
jgi:hypothetical protein